MIILYLPSSLCQQRQLEKPNFKAYPVLMAMEAEWYRKQGHEVYWGKQNGNYNFVFDYGDHKVLPYDRIIREPEGLPFLSLPHPDRVFTRWWEYQDNGNFKYHPGTYIQAANGCWWARCSFCVEKGKPYEVREVDDVIDEIKECQKLGFKEVFDDSGTFPTGDWLDTFCHSCRRIGLVLGCNFRMVDVDYKMMKRAGFRMLLFGLESANQSTLDKINKEVKVEDVKYIIKAARAGLDCHLAIMVGFPWETEKETLNTVNLVKWLLIKGYAQTAQCSFYTPPKEQEQGNEQYRKHINHIYDVAFNPLFWYNKIKRINTMDDIKYLIRQIQEGAKGKWGTKK